MKRKLNVHHDAEDSAIWWRPFLEWQQEAARFWLESFQKLWPDSKGLPQLNEVQESWFNQMQDTLHRTCCSLYNNRQCFTPWMTGSMTEPYINISETNRTFKIEADVPGVAPNSLQVSVGHDMVVISGQHRKTKQANSEVCLRHECHEGPFSRSIALPESADIDKARASLNQHTLHIVVPKQPASSGKRMAEKRAPVTIPVEMTELLVA